MRMRLFVLVIVGTCLLQASGNLWAQPFSPPGPGTDTTTSLGQFSIVLNPSVSGAFVGTPGYSASTNIFTSPVLFDSTTQINRSASLLLGNGVSVSAQVGSLTGGTVSSNPSDTALSFSGNTGVNSGLTYPIPTGSGATAPNTNAVFTQINSFDLVGGGMSVTAGTSAGDPNLPASVGQVTSNSSTGGFPARSFFDVFVDINTTLPAGLGGGTATLTNATVYSGTTALTGAGTPLMISNSGITAFPPVVIYTHGNSSAVPLYDETPGTFQGDMVGLLVLAGHGVGYAQTGSIGNVGTDENTGQPATQTNFTNTYNQMLTSGDTLPIPSAYANWAGPSYNGPVVPEPSTFALLAVFTGGSAVAFWRRRARRQ
jgi:hypothetical protein